MSITESFGHSYCSGIGLNALLQGQDLHGNGNGGKEIDDRCVFISVPIGCLRHRWGLCKMTSNLNVNIYIHVCCQNL